MLYGIPYQGSKTKIAERIIETLPYGKRFVDLFGGGFAMSECALRSYKYDYVLYNDFNAQLVELIRRAINGEFNYSRFKPEFITREAFAERKDTDPYVKWIWSFGNGGNSYLFGTDIEPMKRDIHDAVVFGIESKYFPDFHPYGEDIKERRLQWRDYCKNHERNDLPQLERLQQLERLERLQQLERLERLQQLERLERLELSSMSYSGYQYREGDVVYCDPPYEESNDSKCYGLDFDSSAFYDWVASRDYPVYFSNYDITDDRFILIREWEIKSSMSGGNSCERTEKLYCNRKHEEIQLRLF